MKIVNSKSEIYFTFLNMFHESFRRATVDKLVYYMAGSMSEQDEANPVL